MAHEEDHFELESRDEPDEHAVRGVPLDELDPETQLDVMRNWFFRNYTNPIDNSPYEGGYVFIWGGPYDARRQLNAEFEGIVPDEVIEELADELDDITTEWTGNPDEQAVDDYEFYFPSSTTHYQSFDLAMTNVDLLIGIEVESNLVQPFLRVMYANAITALETYLFDFFYAAIKADNTLFRKFVETHSDFEKKVPLSDVFKEHDKIQQTVQESLIGIAWHNLPRVRKLFKEVLAIEFDDERMRELLPSIAIRHDIVHRNGKNRSDVEMTLTPDQMIPLMNLVRNFVDHIEAEWQKKIAVDLGADSPC
jgi:hypothetical protein